MFIRVFFQRGWITQCPERSGLSSAPVPPMLSPLTLSGGRKERRTTDVEPGRLMDPCRKLTWLAALLANLWLGLTRLLSVSFTLCNSCFLSSSFFFRATMVLSSATTCFRSSCWARRSSFLQGAKTVVLHLNVLHFTWGTTGEN